MQSRLLIINCPSQYFAYIPMGTFGLCDYLGQRNMPARILNLALYDQDQVELVLDQYLEEFRPTHIGLIFHWQETAEGVLWVSEQVKSRMDGVKTVCGGFTAGYFGEALLKKCPHVDYVIRGDPERPMERLLGGAELGEIPNLIYKDSTGVRVNKTSYCADQETISNISFSILSYLVDHELYMQTVEKKLGFPLFIGRGCIFGCDYCGGSRESFRLHSARVKPVTRSIASIIADLKRLKGFTRRIYICYEIDRAYIRALFEVMKGEEGLVKQFRLNYGAWDLLDTPFLELYKDLFILDRQEKPLFEISPEVFDSKSRKRIKHQETYSIEELKENLDLIFRTLDHSVKVYVFFSRYHSTAQTYAAVREEILKIHQLKHVLVAKGLTDVRVYYDHLSTDIGSNYWERYVDNPKDLDTLISWTTRLKSQEAYSYSVNNLCIYTPADLSEREILRCELLIHVLKSLEKNAHAFFQVLFQCLDEHVIDLLEDVMEEVYMDRAGNPFRALDLCEVFRHLERRIAGEPSLLARIPFVEDITRLHIKKIMCGGRPPRTGKSHPRRRPSLNHAFISIHDHDYLDVAGFLKRLEKEEPQGLRQEKTVSVFFVDEVMTMPFKTYDMTIEAFERGTSLDEYYALMEERGIFDLSYHKNLIAKMFESQVLY